MTYLTLKQKLKLTNFVVALKFGSGTSVAYQSAVQIFFLRCCTGPYNWHYRIS